MQSQTKIQNKYSSTAFKMQLGNKIEALSHLNGTLFMSSVLEASTA